MNESLKATLIQISTNITRGAIGRYQMMLKSHGHTPQTSEKFKQTLEDEGILDFIRAVHRYNNIRAKNQLENLATKGVNNKNERLSERLITAAFNIMTPFEWLAVAGFGKPELVEKIYANTPLVDWGELSEEDRKRIEVQEWYLKTRENQDCTCS